MLDSRTQGEKEREDQSALLRYEGPEGRQRWWDCRKGDRFERYQGVRHGLISGWHLRGEGKEAVLVNVGVWKDEQGHLSKQKAQVKGSVGRHGNFSVKKKKNPPWLVWLNGFSASL